MMMKANVLGTEYEIIIDKNGEKPYLKEVDGFTDYSTKQIYVDDFSKIKNDPAALADLKNYESKVIRHELIHAFLYESGLSVNSEWAKNEEMVDFFAIQFSKIQKVFDELKNI